MTESVRARLEALQLWRNWSGSAQGPPVSTGPTFEWLDKAVEYHDPGLADIPVEPLFSNIHHDPRWLPFLRKIGKAPEQLAAIKFDVKVPN